MGKKRKYPYAVIETEEYSTTIPPEVKRHSFSIKRLDKFFRGLSLEPEVIDQALTPPYLQRVILELDPPALHTVHSLHKTAHAALHAKQEKSRAFLPDN